MNRAMYLHCLLCETISLIQIRFHITSCSFYRSFLSTEILMCFTAVSVEILFVKPNGCVLMWHGFDRFAWNMHFFQYIYACTCSHNIARSLILIFVAAVGHAITVSCFMLAGFDSWCHPVSDLLHDVQRPIGDQRSLRRGTC